MFPNRAVMYVSAFEDSQYKQSKFDFWDDVYGVDMGIIKNWAIKEPLVECLESGK